MKQIKCSLCGVSYPAYWFTNFTERVYAKTLRFRFVCDYCRQAKEEIETREYFERKRINTVIIKKEIAKRVKMLEKR